MGSEQPLLRKVPTMVQATVFDEFSRFVVPRNILPAHIELIANHEI